MDNQNQTEIKNKPSAFRWLIFLPAAVLIAIVVSLLLGLLLIKIGFQNQTFLDGVSAFVGTFLFTFFAGYFAPSKKVKITEIIFWIIIFLAILSLVLGFLGVYIFAKMETPNSIIPVLQILGALYAVVLISPLTTQGTTLDQLWGKIAGLGGMVTFLGGAILILGILIGFFTNGWTILSIGAIVLGMGVITWLFPYIHLFLRFRNLIQEAKKMAPQLKEQSEIILRKDKEWSLIDSELCLVTDFLPLMGSTVKDGVAISPVTSVPYASVTIECKKITEKITGFITHKMDFAHLWAAFEERRINEEKEEVLIYWSTKHYKYKIYQALSTFLLTILGGTPFPKIIVMICPKDRYKKFTSQNNCKLPLNEEVLVSVYGFMPIKWWKPDVMK